MTWLTVTLFAEFAGLALLAPALTIFQQRLLAKLLAPAVVPLLVTAPLALAVHGFLPDVSLLEILRLQLAAVAFGLGLAGLATLAGRRWAYAGPLLVTVLALLVLGSPLWGDVALNLAGPAGRGTVLRILVDANPLFSVAQRLRCDWLHGNVLYVQHLSRIGEDFAYRPAPLLWLALGYAAVGLLAAGLAVLIRPRGGRADFLNSSTHF